MTSTSPAERFRLGMENPHRASVMYPPARGLFAPFRVEATPQLVRTSLAEAAGPVGLYLHVPFCETHCAWCDYATLPLARFADRLDAYVDGLIGELEALRRALGSVELSGLDIGGGTPGVLSAVQFARLLEAVEARFDLAPGFEVSTETTPRLAASDPAKWRAIAAAGVRRVSMGVQTADSVLLALLNRAGQGADEVRRGVDVLRDAGFAMLNLDLMFGLPGQTDAAWEQALDVAIAAAPDVVTTYDTVFKNRPIARSAASSLPGPERYGELYEAAFSRLTAAGYASRYGSVNFSRIPGRLGTSRYLESRILDGASYVGAGLYASSLVGEWWRFGRREFASWLETARAAELGAEDMYRLPREHVMAKHVLLALSYGFVDGRRFDKRFGVGLESPFGGALAWLEARGLLQRAADGWELVRGAFAAVPGIRACFYPEDALRWLELPVGDGRAMLHRSSEPRPNRNSPSPSANASPDGATRSRLERGVG